MEEPQVTKGEQTRQEILVAAKRLFLSQGFTATPMRQIAREVGITPAAIYNHYPSKDRLFTTLLQNAAPYDELFALFSKIEAGSAGGPGASDVSSCSRIDGRTPGLSSTRSDRRAGTRRRGAGYFSARSCCPGRRDGISGWWCWMPRPASARRAVRGCEMSPSQYFFGR